ncbi:MAG: glycosyltransferase family 2 protein [Clostridia bacterium]|nr:glycosyltransferase family 2 protein [Clostridia bacterium]
MKKISVIMGIYNCADTLPRAIESILHQTYTNWELILCDDASQDNTYEIAEQYRDLYPDKIILIRNEKHMRLAASLNHCLEYASGELIARMDGDDESCPERFEKQMQYLESHPEVDLVGTAIMRVNDGRYFLLRSVRDPDRYTLRNTLPFHHATILTYKYVYDKVGGYTVAERTRRAEDLDLWYKFYACGFSGNNIEEPLYTFYENKQSIYRRRHADRWQSFLVTVEGFKKLQYPRIWLVKPFATTLVKSVTPYWVFNLYRKCQHYIADKRS